MPTIAELEARTRPKMSLAALEASTRPSPAQTPTAPQPVTQDDLEAWRQQYPDARNIPDDRLAVALAEHRQNPSGTLQAPQPLTGAAGFGRNFGNQMGMALRSFPATSGLMTPEFGQQDFTEQQPGEGVGGFLGSAVGSAIRSATALATGPAGAVVALAPMAGEAMGQKMRSVQDQGGSIPQQVISGLGAGTLETATEYLPIPFLKKLAEMPIKGAGRIGAKALQVLGISAVEGSEEVANTIGQNVVDAADGVQTWEQAAQNIARDAPGAFAGGAVGGAVVGAPVLMAGGSHAAGKPQVSRTTTPQSSEPGVAPQEKPIPGGFGKMSGPLPVVDQPSPAPVEPQPAAEPTWDSVVAAIRAERAAVPQPEPQPVAQVPLPPEVQGEGRGQVQPVVEQAVAGQEQVGPPAESVAEPDESSRGLTRLERARDVVLGGAWSPYVREFGSIAGAKRAIAEETANEATPQPSTQKPARTRKGVRSPDAQRPVVGDAVDAGSPVPLDQGIPSVVAGEREAPAQPSGAVEGAVKQPWETKRDDYVSRIVKNAVDHGAARKRAGLQEILTPKQIDQMHRPAAAVDHRFRVKSAIDRGETVPPEVLADYPDLAAKVKPNEQAETPPLQGPPQSAQEEYEYVTEQADAATLGLSPQLAEAIPENGAALEENDSGGHDLVFDRPVMKGEAKRLTDAGWVKTGKRKYSPGAAGRTFDGQASVENTPESRENPTFVGRSSDVRRTTPEPSATDTPETGRTVGLDVSTNTETVADRLAGGRSAAFGTLIDKGGSEDIALSFIPDNSEMGTYSVKMTNGAGKSRSVRMKYRGRETLESVAKSFAEYLNTDAEGSPYSIKIAPARARPAAISANKPEQSSQNYKDQARAEIKKHTNEKGEARLGSHVKYVEAMRRQIASDPSKWKPGMGVAYRVANQINRGFRIESVDAESGMAVVRSVRDTGLTTSGGNTDDLGAQTVRLGDLIRAKQDDASTLADKLSSIESAARERRQSRKIKRGKGIGATTLGADAIDFIIESGAGAAKDLIFTTRAIKDYVAARIPEHLKSQLKEIQRRVVRLVRSSINEEGTAVSPKAFRDAYKQATAAEPSNTRKARLEGYSKGSRGVLAGLQSVIRRAKKVGGKDEAARSLGIRKEITKLVRENMPPQYRGALLTDVAKAKDIRSMAAAIRKMESVLLRGETRRFDKFIRQVTGKKRLKKFTEDRRNRLREIRSRADILRQSLMAPVNAASSLAKSAGGVSPSNPRKKAAPIAAVREMHREIRELSEEAATIISDQRAEREISVLNKKAQTQALVAEAKTNLAKRKTLPTGPSSADPRKDVGFLRRHFRDLWTPDTLAMVLDGDYSGKGVFHRLLVEAFRTGHRDKLKAMHGHYDAINELAKGAGFNGIGDALRVLSGSMGKQDVKTVNVSVGPFDKISLGNAMHLYAMDPQTRARAIEGSDFNFDTDKKGKPFTLSQSTFDAAEAALTDGQKKFVDGIKAIIESRRDAVFKVHRELKGFDPEAVKDYFPIRLNRDILPAVPENWKEHASRFLENAGLLKSRERSSGATPMLVGDFLRTAMEHLESVESIVNLAIPTRNAHLILRDTDVQRAMRERFGESAVQRVKQVITDSSGTNDTSYDAAERVLSRLTSNVSRALTAVNPFSWGRQLGGLATLSTEMPKEVFADGMKALFIAPGSTAKRMMQDPYFRQRYGDNPSARYSGVQEKGADLESDVPLRVVGGAMQRALAAGDLKSAAWNLPPRLFDKIRIANYFDMVSSIVAYGGYEAEAKRMHPEWSAERVAEYAGEKAGEAVRNTQNTHDLLDSNALVSYATRNVALKPFLAFTSDSSKQYNLLFRAFADRKKNPKKALKAMLGVAANIAWGSLLTAGSASLAAAISAKIMGNGAGEEERRKKAEEAAAWSFIQGVLGMTPAGGMMAQAVRSWSSGFDSSPVDAPVAMVFDNLGRGGKALMDAVQTMNEEIDAKYGGDVLDEKKKARIEKATRQFLRGVESSIIGGSAAIGAPLPPLYWQAKKAYKAATEKPNKSHDSNRPRPPQRPKRPANPSYRQAFESATR